MAFESAYTALLSGDSTTVITGNIADAVVGARRPDVYALNNKGPDEKSLGPFSRTAASQRSA